METQTMNETPIESNTNYRFKKGTIDNALIFARTACDKVEFVIATVNELSNPNPVKKFVVIKLLIPNSQ